jgi:hypothetical protein
MTTNYTNDQLIAAAREAFGLPEDKCTIEFQDFMWFTFVARLPLGVEGATKEDDDTARKANVVVCDNYPFGGYDKVTVLAHECVHARQIIEGRLHVEGKGRRRGVVHYNGKSFLAEAGTNRDSPWEQEAYGNQDAWARKLLDTCARLYGEIGGEK